MISRRTLIRAGMAAPLIFFFAIILLAWGNGAQAVSGSRLLLLSGGHAAWTPLNLPSLVAWWDAQDTAHISLSGSNVTSWTDKKGGIVASQGTGANQPTWSATARNGKPGITFLNSSSQHLAFAPTGLPSASGNSWIALAGQSTNASYGYAFSYGGNGTAGDRRSVGSNSATDVYADYDGKSNTSAVLWNNTDQFLESYYSGTTASIVVNGGPPANATFSINTPLTFGQIGAEASSSGGGAYWNGVTQQILVLNSILTTCQQQKLEGWESWYDGKNGSNLPSNHPYKSGAPLAGGAC